MRANVVDETVNLSRHVYALLGPYQRVPGTPKVQTKTVQCMFARKQRRRLEFTSRTTRTWGGILVFVLKTSVFRPFYCGVLPAVVGWIWVDFCAAVVVNTF